jgi:hypothetical protein
MGVPSIRHVEGRGARDGRPDADRRRAAASPPGSRRRGPRRGAAARRRLATGPVGLPESIRHVEGRGACGGRPDGQAPCCGFPTGITHRGPRRGAAARRSPSSCSIAWTLSMTARWAGPLRLAASATWRAPVRRRPRPAGPAPQWRAQCVPTRTAARSPTSLYRAGRPEIASDMLWRCAI